MVNTPKSRIRQQARLARHAVRRFRQETRYGRNVLASAPIFFANSFPKSGTHLLTQVLSGFTRLGPAVNSGLPAITTFEGDTGRQRPVDEILNDLKRLQTGDIGFGHLHAQSEIVSFLCQDGTVPYFILRDPRDVVVSHAHYVTEMAPNHIHHHYYSQVLGSFDERLKASIMGRRDDKPTEILFPNILERFNPYMDWLDHLEVLLLRFEDFITNREATLAQVLDHAVARGFRLVRSRATAIQTLAECINPQNSPTFRSGKIGGWRASFTKEHKQLFKEVTGDLLIRLGYETSDEW